MSDAERRWVRILMIALEESVRLQSHYAELLNMHDDGERLEFSCGRDWLERLAVTGTIPSDAVSEIFASLAKPPEEKRR